MAAIVDHVYRTWPGEGADVSAVPHWIDEMEARLKLLRQPARSLDTRLDAHVESAIQLLGDYRDLLTSNRLLVTAVRGAKSDRALGLDIDLGVLGAQVSTKGGMPGAILGLALLLTKELLLSGDVSEEFAETVKTQAAGLQRRYDSARSALGRAGLLPAEGGPFEAWREAEADVARAEPGDGRGMGTIGEALGGLVRVGKLVDSQRAVLRWLPEDPAYSPWRLDHLILAMRLSRRDSYRAAEGPDTSTPLLVAALPIAGNRWASVVDVGVDLLAQEGHYPLALRGLRLLSDRGAGAENLYRRARILSLSGDKDAMGVLKQALNSGYLDLVRVRQDPDLDSLRALDAPAFEELCAPRFHSEWIDGVLSSDLKFTNRAEFPFTNVKVVVALKWSGGTEEEKVLEVDYLAPGASHVWTGVVGISVFENCYLSLKSALCDQVPRQ